MIEAIKASSPKKKIPVSDHYFHRHNKMDLTSQEELKHSKKKGKRSCKICSNHGIQSNLKGHKRLCPFLNCHCELCVKGRKHRGVMKKQVYLRRQQMKAIENNSAHCISTAVEPIHVNISPARVKSESPIYEEQNTMYENEKAAKNGNGGLIQSVSKILNSQFGVPRHHPFNCSVCLPTPTPLYQLPWRVGDIYTGGFHQNNWHGSQPETGCFSMMEPLTRPNFTVSDNSAFVKYSDVSPRVEINPFRFGLSQSFEGAAVLESFAGIRSMENRNMKEKIILNPYLS